MIRFTVTYPATVGATFDHEYYRSTHVPLCKQAWGLDAAEIDRGIDGPNVAGVHFIFESLDAFHAAMAAPDSAAVHADIPNYTTISPVIQISTIVE